MEDLHKALEAVGLSKKEAVIYIATLQSGKSSPSDLAKVTHIRRTTLYQHIDTLLLRGFISKSLKGKRIVYIPENPKKILNAFEKGRNLFLSQAPQIEQLYKTARHEPSTRVFEGPSGIAQVLHEIAASRAPIDAFFSPEKYFRSVSQADTREFLAVIEKNQNMLRDLVERDARAEEFVKEVRKHRKTYHRVKLLPKHFSVSIDMLVTGDKVAMISFDTMIGLIVENAEIARFHKSIHNFFWENLS